MILALALFLAAPASAPVITPETRPELFRDEPPSLQAASQPSSEPAESPTWFWVKMLLRTTAVLAVIVLLAYLILNKGMTRLMKLTGAGGQRTITIIERTALSQKHQVYIVEVDGRRFMIGTAEQSIAMLAELTERAMTKESA